MSPTIAYFVHDLNDAAVAKRVRSLKAGGARITVAGFHRREVVAEVAGVPATALGASTDAALLTRSFGVLRHLVLPQKVEAVADGCDVLLARNLEMLVIAASVARPGQRVVYELLDVHRLLLDRGLKGRVLRAIERLALTRTGLVMVSSPAFERHYLRAVQRHRGPSLLIENKVAASRKAPSVRGEERGQPWRIGWFGMLRCARSLVLLTDIAARSGGEIEVVLAGRPAQSELVDFEERVGTSEGVEFQGSYEPDDLASLYGAVDFAWCIDFFEEGLNSDWLLPNRLYESIAHGVVPVALAGVECGRWLARHDVGIRLPRANDIGGVLEGMSTTRYADLARAVGSLDMALHTANAADDRALVGRLQAA